MNVLLLRWDTKPDKRIRRTFVRLTSTRRRCFYAAMRSLAEGASLRRQSTTLNAADECGGVRDFLPVFVDDVKRARLPS
jgi:hypothetical protein